MTESKPNRDKLESESENLPQKQNTAAQLLFFPALVSFAYYFSVKIGIALSFKPELIAVFWPPNSIVVAALFLTLKRRWPFYILAICPAYFIASNEAGFPVVRAIIFFASNCIEILIPSICYLRLNKKPQFEKIKDSIFYLVIVVFLSPLISASVASLGATSQPMTIGLLGVYGFWATLLACSLFFLFS